MARYNEILVGRYARAVQKLFGMKGEVPVGSLAGELQIVHGVFNGAENRYLEGWDKFAFLASATGGAAQQAGIRYRNPQGSNMIAVVELIMVSNQTAGVLNVSLQRITTTSDLTTIVSLATNRVPDGRQRPSPTMILSTDTNASSTGLTMMGGILLNTNTTFLPITTDNQEFAITPGEAIQFTSNTVAVQMNAGIWWRERFLEDSERA